MRARHRFLAHCILLLAILALVFLSLWLPKVTDPLLFREYIRQAGPLGYVLVILLIALSIPLPIPSNIVTISGGYVYGLIPGMILSFIGTVIGGSVSFLMVRKLGRPFLDKMVSHHHIVHFNYILKKRGFNAALISLAIPLFPADSVYFLLGLSTIRYHAFLALIILGNIPRYLIINGIGSDLYGGFTARSLVLLLLASIFTLIAILREKVKRFIFHEIKEFEQEAKLVEEVVEEEVKLMEEKVGIKRKKAFSKGAQAP